ncbi:DDE-type integrase/transposase/recombinase [Flavobacteriaceae bacterium]|nr:DDE-type integrase/transposase/recombinase [Flavobacteriaceae bacterium]MDC1266118.1 DDE-type integrase/transposase/recombinase [Flavobacteriaceae bacterium]
MSQYNSYHSAVKTSYALGIENQVLPDTFTQKIPRSTTYDWKHNICPDDFVGSEFANQIQVDLEQVKLILDKRLAKMRRGFYVLSRLYITLLDFIDKKNFEKLILQNREVVVDLVDNLPVEFNRSLVCRFLQISEHQFKIWKNNRRFKCSSSLIGYCTKRFPTQISQKEINVLKSFMSRRRFSTWSIGSIWGFAFKKGFISMSRTYWYRYCLKLDISKQRKVEKAKRKRNSVKASHPNEIWHMDVTEFTTIDYVKFYIHTVLDNFSRKILTYTISKDINC